MGTGAAPPADLGRISVDELAAVLTDLMTRSLLAVLEAFDDRVEELNRKALSADTTLLEDLTAVRTDLIGVRRVVHPLREALDVLRHSTSDLVSDAGRRRFSDVFDVASRLADGLDEARAALAETLDAYRGAEARQATEVSKVLTVYAAILLPLGFIAGFFGMNFTNLPWTRRSWGWILVTPSWSSSRSCRSACSCRSAGSSARRAGAPGGPRARVAGGHEDTRAHRRRRVRDVGDAACGRPGAAHAGGPPASAPLRPTSPTARRTTARNRVARMGSMVDSPATVTRRRAISPCRNAAAARA